MIGAIVGRSYNRTLANVGDRSARLRKQLEATNARLKATGDVVRYRKVLETLRRKQADAGRTSDRLERGIRDVERRYREAKRAVKTYGIEVGRAAAEQKRLARAARATERALQRQERKRVAGGRLGQMRPLMGSVAGATYAAARLFSAAATREEQALHLENVIGGPDPAAAVGRALEHGRRFSADTLATDAEMLDIRYQLGSAGLVDEEVARRGAEITHKVATITKGSSAAVGKVLATVKNNLGGDLAEIGNVLTATQFRYAFDDFGQLGESFKEAASAAIQFGVPLAPLTAVLGELNTAGLEGSRAGTAMSAVLRRLTAASEQLGTSVVQDRDGMLDLAATLQQINDATADLDRQSRANLLQKLFGEEGGRGIGLLLPKLDNLRAANKDLRAAAASDLVSERYKAFVGGASGQWKIFARNVSEVGIVFASVLMPALAKILSPLAGLARWVGDLLVRYPLLAQVVGWLAGTLGVAVIAVGVMTGAIWLWNAALLANPIVRVVAAVVAGLVLVAGVVGWLWNNWDKATKWFESSAVRFLPPILAIRWMIFAAKRLWRVLVLVGEKIQWALEKARKIPGVGAALAWFGDGDAPDAGSAAQGAGVPAVPATVPAVGGAVASPPVVAPAAPAGSLPDLSSLEMPDLSGAAAAPTRQTTIHVDRPVIEVHAAPGTDARDVAALVDDRLDQMTRDAARRAARAQDDG